MIAFRKTRQASSFPPRAGGFTLIELLAVISILAILVVLVVGVGMKVTTAAHVNQSKQTMGQLLAAIGAYYESYTEYPPDHDSTSSGNFVALPADSNPYHSGDGIGVLYMYLTGKHFRDNNYTPPLDRDLATQACAQAAKPYLDKLPATVWTASTHGFMDGFGMLMRYQIQGGKPLLISAGPDAKFDTGDDIRSDGH